MDQYKVNAFNSHSQLTATANAQMDAPDPVPQGIFLTVQEDETIHTIYPYIYIHISFCSTEIVKISSTI